MIRPLLRLISEKAELPVLELKDYEAYYGNSKILHGINLSVGKGEAFAVLGRNGVGKTTLLKAIMGLPTRVRGRLVLEGKDLSSASTHVRARSGIGYVPQNREIIRGFSVRENLLMGCYARKDVKQAIPELIWELFPFLTEHLNREGANLSGGQQQQLAIARALVGEPSILLLDEPTEGIQPNIVEQIGLTVHRLNMELGLTVIIVEQQLQFTRDLCSRFAMIEKGQIAMESGIENLTSDVVRRYLSV